MAVSEAVEQVTGANIHQPVILKVSNSFVIKLDQIPVPIECASLIDAVYVLLQVFYVFGLEYPWHLRAVYGYFEGLCGLPVTVKNLTTIGAFKRSLKQS